MKAIMPLLLLAMMTAAATATDPKPLKAFCPECVAASAPASCPTCPAVASVGTTAATSTFTTATHTKPLREFVSNILARPLIFRGRCR
jgi:hypothetical protein